MNTRPHMTPNRRDELRVNNQCFICEQSGHLAKDCPKRTTVTRAPTIHAATVNFAKMQSIEDKARDLDALQISTLEIAHKSISDAHSHTSVQIDDQLLARTESDTAMQCKMTTLVGNQKGKGKDPTETYPNYMTALEQNAAKPKDFTRIVPKAIIVQCHIEGQSMRALIYSGSFSDFISTVMVDQLKLTAAHLVKPIACQMAASGSRTMITSSVEAKFTYQDINEQRRFDVINLENHDVILGTPFLWQHKMILGFNPAKIIVGNNGALPLEGEEIAKISSMTADFANTNLESLRELLRREASDLCKRAEDTPLPPLQMINHRMPTIDSEKRYTFRPSRCPEILRPLWIEKCNKYLKSGRWERRVGGNAIPMLLLHKKPGPDGVPRLCTVLDAREQNLNTKKMASPLPDQQEILSNVCRH